MWLILLLGIIARIRISAKYDKNAIKGPLAIKGSQTLSQNTVAEEEGKEINRLLAVTFCSLSKNYQRYELICKQSFIFALSLILSLSLSLLLLYRCRK